MTGRAQVIAIPEQEELRLGDAAWRELLEQEQVSDQRELAVIVERVGRRLANVSGRPDYPWEFKLLASGQANAFCLPGGKVAVYSGILPVCENEAGLAVVMSHEIAHALARHGGERMTQEAAVNVSGGVLERMTKRGSTDEAERWRHAYGIGSKYGVLLPFSRKHETEADAIGLTLMARAGYDPSEAPRFWERFAQRQGGQAPEFLSTHPADATRAAHLRSLLPRAQAQYRSAPEQLGTGVALQSLPATNGATGRAALAQFEVSPNVRVIPAAHSDEFVPPIQRSRTDPSAGPTAAAPATQSPAASATSASEPLPFPDLPP